MIAIIYARYSPRPDSAKDGEGLHDSIAYQIEMCQQYARMRQWEIWIPAFTDEGISGKTLVGRSGLAAALAEVARTPNAVLLSYSLSRLARNTRDAIELSERVAKMGRDIACVKDSIDTSSPAGRLFFTILAAIATFEREQTIERTMDAMRCYQYVDLRAMGSQPPFGFAFSGNRLIPLEREIAIIREMQRHSSSGLSVGEIAKIMRGNDIKLRGLTITAKTVTRCLAHADEALQHEETMNG